MKRFCEDPSAQGPTTSEFGLVRSLTAFFEAQGYDVRLEVSNMGQSIDLVAIKGKGRRLATAIEAKRTNWRRALSQCRAHALVCDYIAVALALKSVPVELRTRLEISGWGLLMYDYAAATWYWEIRPKKNTHIWQPQRRRFLATLREFTHGS